MRSKVVQFPPGACSPPAGHRFSQGGLPVEIKHVHPKYENAGQRLERLQELRNVCVAKLKPAIIGGKSA